MPFPHKAILGIIFSSVLLDVFIHHLQPKTSHDGKKHPCVLRKSLSLELPNIKKSHSFCLFLIIAESNPHFSFNNSKF